MTEQELYDGLKQIAEAQEAAMRQCRIMVAGFKATGEQDIRYRDCGTLWNKDLTRNSSKGIILHTYLHSILKKAKVDSLTWRTRWVIGLRQ